MNMPVNSLYYVLDLDRCIANTERLYGLLEAIVLDKTSITKEDMTQARVAVENSSGSFNTADYIQEHLRSVGQLKLWDAVAAEFIQRATQVDMFEPGAKELLHALRTKNIPHGILTYGGRTWQGMKIQVLHLNESPYMITETKEKGRIIAGWQLRDGTFALPPELHHGEVTQAQTVVLVDDKASSFIGLPKGAQGIHVLPGDGQDQLPSQQGSLPESVVQARGLEGVLGLINTRNV